MTVTGRVLLRVAITTLVTGAPAGLWAQPYHGSPEPSKPAAGAPSIQQDLDNWYRRAVRVAPGRWGIAVANGDGQLLWAQNATTPLIPASTVKVFTTGFARTIVGAEARRSTRVVGEGSLDPITGSWLGTWALEVNGDFTFERPGKSGPTLDELAARLAAGGVKALTGPFTLLSESGQTANAVFPSVWADRHRGRIFAPPVGSATINENTVTIRVAPGKVTGKAPIIVGESPAGVSRLVRNTARTVGGSATRLTLRTTSEGKWILGGTIGVRSRGRGFTVVATNPSVLLEAAWARALAKAGIKWDPTPGLRSTDFERREVLAEVASLPFDSVASEINSRSHNLGAELLLQWAAGTDIADAASRLTQHVRQVTGDPWGVSLVDGSGLSEDDRATAWSFVAYLARLPLLPGGHNFPALLPANGEGTLKRLASGLPAEGVVRAKTGTLANVASVTGYLGSRNGVLIVSLLYNGVHTGAARNEQWRLFRLLGAQGNPIPTDAPAENLGSNGDR